MKGGLNQTSSWAIAIVSSLMFFGIVVYVMWKQADDVANRERRQLQKEAVQDDDITSPDGNEPIRIDEDSEDSTYHPKPHDRSFSDNANVRIPKKKLLGLIAVKQTLKNGEG